MPVPTPPSRHQDIRTRDGLRYLDLNNEAASPNTFRSPTVIDRHRLYTDDSGNVNARVLTADNNHRDKVVWHEKWPLPLATEYTHGWRLAGWSLSSFGNTATADRYYGMPIILPERTGYDALICHVTTAAAAGKKARMGIYTHDFDDRRPGTLLVDSGEFAIDSTGIKIVAVTASYLDAGLYWLALHPEANAQFYAQFTTTAMAITHATGAGFPAVWRFYGTQAYGALPATFGAPTSDTLKAFVIMLRVVAYSVT